jgi:hypothetical protein
LRMTKYEQDASSVHSSSLRRRAIRRWTPARALHEQRA